MFKSESHLFQFHLDVDVLSLALTDFPDIKSPRKYTRILCTPEGSEELTDTIIVAQNEAKILQVKILVKMVEEE